MRLTQHELEGHHPSDPIALYLKNHLPHSFLQGRITPHEIWHGVKPALHHLRVFGSRAHVYIPEECRKAEKVELRSNRLYSVGYEANTEKIYKLWNPATKQVIRGRNIGFGESQFGSATHSASSTSSSHYGSYTDTNSTGTFGDTSSTTG
jgi:hypothetical protein